MSLLHVDDFRAASADGGKKAVARQLVQDARIPVDGVIPKFVIHDGQHWRLLDEARVVEKAQHRIRDLAGKANKREEGAAMVATDSPSAKAAARKAPKKTKSPKRLAKAVHTRKQKTVIKPTSPKSQTKFSLTVPPHLTFTRVEQHCSKKTYQRPQAPHVRTAPANSDLANLPSPDSLDSISVGDLSFLSSAETSFVWSNPQNATPTSAILPPLIDISPIPLEDIQPGSTLDEDTSLELQEMYAEV